MSVIYIVGVSGEIGSGKSAVANSMKMNGFHVLSSSNYLKKILQERGLETSRDNLQIIGEEMRYCGSPLIDIMLDRRCYM